MRALIVGIDSVIGGALGEAVARRGDEVLGTTRRRERVAENVVYLDLQEPAAAQSAWPPVDVAFVCAAVTRFADCRNGPDAASRVNVATPIAIAQHLIPRGTRIVFLSTSAVFDCSAPRMRADRPTSPASTYGRLKAEAETALLAMGAAVSVLRLTKVLTPGMKLFSDWIGALVQGKPVRAFSDLRFCPIALDQVVQALLALADHREGGIFQVSGASDLSYADAALHIAGRLEVPKQLVEVCSALDCGIPAEEVMAYTSLDTTRLTELCGFVPPDPGSIIDVAIEPLLASVRRPARST